MFWQRLNVKIPDFACFRAGYVTGMEDTEKCHRIKSVFDGEIPTRTTFCGNRSVSFGETCISHRIAL